jgi:hypothetical protein
MGGVKVHLHAFHPYIVANGQLYAPSRFTPGEIAPGIHWIEDYVGPRIGLNISLKIDVEYVVKRRIGGVEV